MTTFDVVDVLGIPVAAVDATQAVAEVGRLVATKTPAYVCLTGVHGVMVSRREERVREIHQQAHMVLADGVPLYWAGKWAGSSTIRQIRGVDLMTHVFTEASEQGWTSYFYGDSPETLALLQDRLRERFPKLKIVGSWSPPFRALSEEERAADRQRIVDSGAQLVWVGLGTPKQERWMAENVEHLQGAVLFGVGAAFGYHAGVARQAPKWIRGSGFEWMYRLLAEPRRLWRRYLFSNPHYVALIMRHRPTLRSRNVQNVGAHS